MAPFIGTKIVYINYDFCYKYQVKDGKVERTIENNLSCADHEEADTKIVYHICSIDYDANILIRSSDTDVLTIMLGNMEHLKHSQTVWMNVGVANAQRFVNVSELYKKLGCTLCNSLPGFHALTGCDYNPAFFRKGKKKPFTILESSEKYQRAFVGLGNLNASNSKQVFATIEEFVCRLYNERKVNDVDETRLTIFTKTYKADDVHEFFKRRAKNFDASAFPPCRSELRQHILRASYITNIWRNAHLPQPTNLLPTKNGWKEIDGKLDFVWFEGEQLPTLVNDVIVQADDDNDSGMQEQLYCFREIFFFVFCSLTNYSFVFR